MKAASNTDDRLFIEALKASPLAAKIAEDAARKENARRAALADRLAALDVRATAENPRLAKLVEDAIARRADAERMWREADAAVVLANSAHMQSSFAADAARQELQMELREGASALISPFISDMRDEMDLARKAIESDSDSVMNAVTGRTHTRFASNAGSIARRIQALFAAIDKAGAMAFLPDQSQVPGMLAAVRAELPAIERPVLK